MRKSLKPLKHRKSNVFALRRKALKENDTTIQNASDFWRKTEENDKNTADDSISIFESNKENFADEISKEIDNAKVCGIAESVIDLKNEDEQFNNKKDKFIYQNSKHNTKKKKFIDFDTMIVKDKSNESVENDTIGAISVDDTNVTDGNDESVIDSNNSATITNGNDETVIDSDSFISKDGTYVFITESKQSDNSKDGRGETFTDSNITESNGDDETVVGSNNDRKGDDGNTETVINSSNPVKEDENNSNSVDTYNLKNLKNDTIINSNNSNDNQDRNNKTDMDIYDNSCVVNEASNDRTNSNSFNTNSEMDTNDPISDNTTDINKNKVKNIDNRDSVNKISSKTVKKRKKNDNKLKYSNIVEIENQNLSQNMTKSSLINTSTSTINNDIVYYKDTFHYVKDISKITQRNGSYFFINNDDLETGVMNLNNAAYTNSTVSTRSFCMFIMKGCIEVNVNDVKIYLKKNGMCVVNKGDSWSVKNIEKYISRVFVCYSLK